MTELQATIGRRQLLKVPRLARAATTQCRDSRSASFAIVGLRIPLPPPNVSHAFYRFCAFVRPEMLKPDWNRDRILQAIASRGVPCSSGGSGELYLEHAFASLRPPDRFPAARELAETSLAFLVHPTLGKSDMEIISEIASTVLQAATILRRKSYGSHPQDLKHQVTRFSQPDSDAKHEVTAFSKTRPKRTSVTSSRNRIGNPKSLSSLAPQPCTL